MIDVDETTEPINDDEVMMSLQLKEVRADGLKWPFG